MQCTITDSNGETQTCRIDTNEFDRINDYSIKHEITPTKLSKISKGELPIVGDRKEHTYENEYFKFVLSIDNTPSFDFKKMYKLKRLSVSRPNSTRYPSLELVKNVTAYLKFSDLEKCNVKINENDPIPNIEVIDILEETPMGKEESKRIKNLLK